MNARKLPAVPAALCFTLLSFFIASGAVAQSYPNRTIRMVVPFAPGGGTDTTARIVSQRLAEQLGVPVVVDNRPGAGSMLGTELVAKAPPDGYTLLTVAPAGTPREIVARLNAEIVKAVRLPAVRERFATLGTEPVGSTPEECAAFLRAEIDKWAKVVKASGARPD